MYVRTTENVVVVCSCPFCDFTSKQEPRFYVHLEEKHGVTGIVECYIEHVLKGARPVCACPECQHDGTLTKWCGWKKGFPSKFLRGHNAAIDSVFADAERAKEFALKRAEGYRTGRNRIWCEGKTKEDDVRLAVSAEKKSRTLTEGYETGRLVSPRKGQTKETYAPIAKQVETLRTKREQGLLPFSWNEGLTKETDERVARAAASVSAARRSDDWLRLSKDALLARIAEQEIFDLVTPYEKYERKYQHLEFRCRKAGHTQFKTIKMLRDNPTCWDCDPKSSYGQLEIRDFVLSLGLEVSYEDRTVINPKEIDVYVPEKMFGVEYNSLYYHSSQFLPENYHSEKTRLCQERGVTLFHVFSDEWKNKRSIVESMIRSRVGKVDDRVFARECESRELHSSERTEFFNSNHLDGDARSSISWGLFHKGQLVSALSVRKPFVESRKSAGELEICRFASSRNTLVVGALGKLTQRAIEHARHNGFKSIMSYVDLRCGTGKAYKEVGYELVGTTGANRYWYSDGAFRYPRQMYKADGSTGMSEEMVAELEGVVKIFGCPNLIFKKNI